MGDAEIEKVIKKPTSTVTIDFYSTPNEDMFYFEFKPLQLGNMKYIYMDDEIKVIDSTYVRINADTDTSRDFGERLLESIKKLRSFYPSYINIVFDINRKI